MRTYWTLVSLFLLAGCPTGEEPKDTPPGEVTSDADADGVPDGEDLCDGGNDALDGDGDGVPDFCDPCPADAQDDSDGDGVCDSEDACDGADDSVDGDGDGVADGCDPCPADSSDDSDGDGVCDSDDPCPADLNDDSDGDGVCDSVDPCPADLNDDSDGDGVCDSVDPCPADLNDDSDGDGVCDSVDPCPADLNDDSDGDGVCDSDDPCPADLNDDSDGDGVCDSIDLCDGDDMTGDGDNDGLCDDTDPDDDDDGAADGVDSDDSDPFVCSDTDADGCEDCSSGTYDPFDDGADSDGDGLCDLSDPPSCIRYDWKPGTGDFSCPEGYRLPNLAEWTSVEACLTADDLATIDYYQNVAVSEPEGCGCKWNAGWCGQPSIETFDGRMCGDYAQLHVCIPEPDGCSDAASWSHEIAPDLWLCAYNNQTGKTWQQTYDVCNEAGGFHLASVGPMTRRGLPSDVEIGNAMTAAAANGHDYITTGHPARSCSWDSMVTDYESCNGLGYVNTGEVTGAGSNWQALIDGNDLDYRSWPAANDTGAHPLASLCMNASADPLSYVFDHRWR